MDGDYKKSSIRLLAVRGAATAVISLGLIAPGRGASTSAAAPPSSRQSPVPPDQNSISRGRAIYARHCASCHGPSGKGDGSAGRDLDPAPTDLSEPHVAHQTDAELFRKISRGRRPMPAFRRLLDDEDRWHVVNFVRTLARPTEGEARR